MLLNSDSSLQRALLKRQQLRETLPQSIADHVLLGPIAAGSYGEVWLARNELTGTYRAIKFVWSDAFDTAKPYEREFDAIRKFEPISRTHPGFVNILQAGVLPNGFYYVMELADDVERGREIHPESYTAATLSSLKWESGTVERAIRIGIILSESLGILHESGLIHRDVKPSNVIFVDGRPKLADIGLVASASDTNSLVGTNGFIAPEGQTSSKSDIYSLGKLLYEIATGKDRLDFPALPEGVSEQHALLLELNQVLLKACDPDPHKRHRSAAHLREELESLEQGKSILRVRHLERALRWTRASFITFLLCAVALFFAFKALEARRSAAEILKERKIAIALAQGAEEINKGDYLSALSFYAQAAAWDNAERKEHDIRLGTTLMFAPKVLGKWESDSAAACYSEGGKHLTTVKGGTIRIIDATTGAIFKEIMGRANLLATDYEGHRLAVGFSNTISFFDLRNDTKSLKTFPSGASHVSFSDGLAIAITLKSGTIQLLPGNKQIVSNEPNLYRAVLSRSGTFISLLYSNGKVRVLNTQTLQELAPGKMSHGQIVYDATFIRNESALVTSSFDRTSRCWDFRTGKQVGYSMEHEAGIVYAAESPRNDYVVTGSLDRTVRLWQAGTFAQKSLHHTLYHPEEVEWVRFVDSETLLAHCDDGTTWLWSLSEPTGFCKEEPFSVPPPPKLSIKGDDVDLAAVAGRLTGTLGKKQISIEVSRPIETVAINPQKTLIAVGTRDSDRTPHSVLLFNRFSQRVGREMPHRDGITFVVFSPSGELLASCSEDFSARIWDTAGNPVTQKLSHKDQVRWAAFHDSEDWLVTGSYDKTIRIWNAKTGLAITPPMPIRNIVDYVTFENGNVFVGNSRRNYSIKLESFHGNPKVLMDSLAVPSDWLQQLK